MSVEQSKRIIRFSLIGPLRSGSSLLSRCLDDHPHAICLCESEIARTLFPGYFYTLHFRRMRDHGLTDAETIQMLDGRRSDDVGSYEAWHERAFRLLKQRYAKPAAQALGDKSPDFYRNRVLVDHLRSSHRLIYTARDPRAIYRSIEADTTERTHKDRRWSEFLANVDVWFRHLDETNILPVRYEDLVASPVDEMDRIHAHLGLESSSNFLADGPRKFPRRFLWKTNVDPVGGEALPLDSSRIDQWKREDYVKGFEKLASNPIVRSYCDRFGYDLSDRSS